MKLRALGAAAAAVFALGLGCSPAQVRAAEGPGTLDVKWPFDGPFGTYDRASLQRGFQVYQAVCQNCHSMHYLAFRNLADLGYNEDEVKAIAAGYQVTDGPNDQGDMFERPGRPSDHKPGPFPNDQAARAANGGALPPDMSLLAKQHEGGANYIYSILLGYEEPPADFPPLADGQYYNKFKAGHLIAMPAPLAEDAVEYQDGTKATVEQMAHDVSQFMMWIAEPKLEARKQTGLKVMLFLVVLVGIMYAYKRKVWADVH